MIRLAIIRNIDCLEYTLIDWIIFGRMTGPRAAKYLKKTQTKVDKHTVDHKGTEVVMAFT